MKSLPSRKGFTLLEMLCSLMLTSLILSAFIPLLNFCQKLELDTDFQQDLNGIQQLRLYLMLGNITDVTIWEVDFEYKEKEFILEQIDDRLVITPGYNVFLDHIDDIFFDDCGKGGIYLIYTRKNVTRRVMIRE